MKKVDELLIMIEDICPNLKSSEKLFLAGLVLEEQNEAYKEGGLKALQSMVDLPDEEGN